MKDHEYDGLKSIRIIETFIPGPVIGYSVFGAVRGEYTGPRAWNVVYHTVFKKWIVTDNLQDHGLNDQGANLQIIGFADNLDAAMFIIWEHQRSLGIERTILEELQDMRRTPKSIVSDKEWRWGEPRNGIRIV